MSPNCGNRPRLAQSLNVEWNEAPRLDPCDGRPVGGGGFSPDRRSSAARRAEDAHRRTDRRVDRPRRFAARRAEDRALPAPRHPRRRGGRRAGGDAGRRDTVDGPPDRHHPPDPAPHRPHRDRFLHHGAAADSPGARRGGPSKLGFRRRRRRAATRLRRRRAARRVSPGGRLGRLRGSPERFRRAARFRPSDGRVAKRPQSDRRRRHRHLARRGGEVFRRCFRALRLYERLVDPGRSAARRRADQCGTDRRGARLPAHASSLARSSSARPRSAASPHGWAARSAPAPRSGRRAFPAPRPCSTTSFRSQTRNSRSTGTAPTAR